MNRSVLLLLLLLGCYLSGDCLLSQAANPVADTLHFELTTANNIRIQAVVNDQDTVQLMLHTAANAVTLIESVTAELNSLTWTTVDSAQSWGGSHAARRSDHNRLAIGNLAWDSLSIWENTLSGPQTDGKFGLDLFAGQVVEINFDAGIVVLHPHLPERAKTYQRLAIAEERGLFFIEATASVGANEFRNRFLIHSGYGGAILFDDEFARRINEEEPLTVTAESELRDSYGNVIKTQKAILPALHLGSEVLADIPVGFFAGAIGRQKMSVMGGAVLKRFNLFLDAERKYIYLTRNTLKDW